jgi:hypothetical protein
VPFSATRRIGVEAAETTLAQWLPGPLGTEEQKAEPSDAHFGRTKEEAPRPRGMARGPKYPR